MKKNYLSPAIEVNDTLVCKMLAESLSISDTTVDGGEALSKENNDWDIWNGEND